MSTVLLILQLILSVILTVLILLQRSEGGALGIGGGGGGGGGLMSGRSAATSIVRMTAIVGFLFVVNCVALTIVFNMENQESSIFDVDTPEVTAPTPLTETPLAVDENLPSAEETPGVETMPATESETPESETADPQK